MSMEFSAVGPDKMTDEQWVATARLIALDRETDAETAAFAALPSERKRRIWALYDERYDEYAKPRRAKRSWWSGLLGLVRKR